MSSLTRDSKKRLPVRESFRIESILAGLELGPSDVPMLSYLDFIATQIPIGRINFVHIIPRVRLFTSAEEEQSFFEEQYQRTDELNEQIKEKVQGWGFAKRTAHIDYDIRIGNPLEELLNQAKDLKPGLVIIGQRKKKSHHGILARNLARKVNSNALIIPEQAAHQLDHILVPVDFSNHSVKALRLALNLRKWLHQKPRVSCLHIYELPNLPMDRTPSRAKVRGLLKEDRKAAFQAFLMRHFPAEVGKIEIELIQKNGEPISRHIQKFALANQVDMTVMGALGHSRVELLLMGSVTEKYLNLNQQIPTLIVKH